MLKTLPPLMFFSIIFAALSGCKFKKENQKSSVAKEFEGIITYHEITANYSGEFNLNDTAVLFYSHGNYVGVHFTLSPKFHLFKDYYFQHNALRLFLFNNSDTLHQLDLKNSIEKLDSFKVKKIKEQVLSRKCESIELSTSYAEKDSTTYTDYTFIFSRGYLKVDKEHFKNWNLGFFNKVINESGAFYLKFRAIHYDSSHKNILSTKTYEAISVNAQPIDPRVFAIDTTKIKWTKRN